MTTKQKELTIDELRDKMISVGMEKGLSHPETVKLSQELDELLNNKLLEKKEEK